MIELRGVTRAFGPLMVLRGVDLTIADGEIVCLVGGSGSGKSTILRIIAGLETADSGEVLEDGRSIAGVPTHQRGFGLMFQDFALFPHLNVRQNIAFGLSLRGDRPSDIALRVQQVAQLTGLMSLLDRPVDALSGGEKQRVALARSLAPKPRLLMLDEPLGSLDELLRERLVADLGAALRSEHVSALYVTHDQREAFRIADRVGVLHNGRIVQIAAPIDLYQRPETAHVARFLGLTNLGPPGLLREAALPAGHLPESATLALVHPYGISIDPAGQVAAIVEHVSFEGERLRWQVRVSPELTLTFSTGPLEFDATPGALVSLRIDPAWVLPISP